MNAATAVLVAGPHVPARRATDSEAPALRTIDSDRPPRRAIEGDRITLREATAADARAIHTLIVEHLAEGHLLPRELGDVERHAHRFVVAVHGNRVLACAELAPLGRDVAEIRSLVVSRDARNLDLGRQLIEGLVQRADDEGVLRVCAFTHSPAYFVHLGFSIVPHVWLPEKIETTCRICPEFRRCGQYGVVLLLARQPPPSPAAARHA